MAKIYEWEKVYKLALDEKDPAKIRGRRTAAEKVFEARRQALAGLRTRAAINELAWLQKAIDRMAKLRAQKPRQTLS
jgi:hypothetical protein